MSKATPRVILALNDVLARRALDRILSAYFQTVPVLREADLRPVFAQPASVAAVITETMLDTVAGLQVLELTRSLQPYALRIMASNFDEISAVIEGVHNGLVQRVLGLPFTEAEVRGLFTSAGPIAPAPIQRSPIPVSSLRPSV